MKKIMAAILTLALAAAATASAYATEINQDTKDKTVEVTISTSIQPTYTVMIPEDVPVTFNATSTDFGTIELTDALINPGWAVQVDLNASNTLKNEADKSKTIAYTVNSKDGAFTTAQYDAVGESTELTIDITQEAWNSAYAETPIELTAEDFEEAILFVEDIPEFFDEASVQKFFSYLGEKGILQKLNGIIIGKVNENRSFEERAKTIHHVISEEYSCSVPVLYGLNFGHSSPMFVLPYGAMAEIDCEKTTFSILESGVTV